MIKNIEAFEEFERGFIRSEKADFRKNLKIINELHREALKLGVFKKDALSGIEADLKIAKVVNSVRKTP